MASQRPKSGQQVRFTEKTFPEQDYLRAFPDVDSAIREGLIPSAYEHYTSRGRSEIESGLRTGFPPAPVKPPTAGAAKGATTAPPKLTVAASALAVGRNDLTCFIDEIADGQLSGWVRNKEKGYPQLTVVIDRQPVGTFVADGPRPDVLAAYPGTLYVGYKFTLPRRFLNGRVRRLEVCLESGEPIDIMFQERRSHSIDFQQRWQRKIRSNVDGLSNGYIKGWVLAEDGNTGDMKGDAHVLVTLHGARVAQLRANLYRPDVGRGHGADPYCGFEFAPPKQYRLAGAQTFAFRVVPDNFELSGSPATVHFINTRHEAMLSSLSGVLDQLYTDITQFRREFETLLPKPIYTVQDYNIWAARYFPKLRAEAAARAGKDAETQPLVSIICPTYQPLLSDFAQAVESIIGQSYRNWELIIIDDGSKDRTLSAFLDDLPRRDSRIRVHVQEKNGGISVATNAGLALAQGAWIGFMDHDDLLVDVAVQLMMEAARQTDALVLYSDEDKVDRVGTLSAPAFKPDWNYRLMLGVNYVCHFLMVRKDIVDEVGPLSTNYDGAQDHDFILRLSEVVDRDRIHHVPEVLYHWRITENSTASEIGSKPYAISAGIACVTDHLERMGKRAVVKNFKEMTLYRVQWQNVTAPKVAIIIPFKDQIETTRMCLNRIQELTQYADFEVILVDNWSLSDSLGDFVEEVSIASNVRILRVEETYNYSRLNNLAAAQTDAEMYVFMNNDLFVKDRLWLRTLVNEALSDPKVGVVGGKFFYPNGAIQHAGAVLGIGGVAGHVHVGLRADDGGYGGRAFFAQEMSAVTAACMLVKASVFKEVGGLDEVNLQVAFNDIDFCLKTRAAGYQVIWTPDFVADHHESLSRGSDDRPETRERFFHETQTMMERWGDALKHDPYYSKHFDLEGRPFFDLDDPGTG